MRVRTAVALGVLIAGGVAVLYLLQPVPPGPEPAVAPESVPKPRTRSLLPAERAHLVAALKAYLDPDGDFSMTRRALAKTLADLKGYDLLADDQLASLVYQARAFPKPPFQKAHLPKTAEFKETGTTVSLSADLDYGSVKLTLTVPKSYAVVPNPKKPTDQAPTPLLITLHEERDYQGEKGAVKFPGEEVLERRFDPAGPSKAVLSDWAILAPVTPKGRWIADPALVDTRAFMAPLQATWDRYHVDYDRFVIDGTDAALTFAAARPHLFAGVIVRGDAPDLAPDLVRNLAGLSVYVVGSAASAAAKTLAANGHPADRVKIGGPEGLAEWLKTVRRTVPKSFHWTMKDSGMRAAQWIQITSIESTVVPTVDVEVVDTTDEPNTIKIRTKGVRGIGLLLNDRIVDLDREVRVVINRQPLLKGARIREGEDSLPITLPAKLSRSVETTFAAKPLNVRRNLAYGMLYPVILDGIAIPTDDPDGAPAAPAPRKAQSAARPADAPKTPEEIEAEAKRLFEKAESLEKSGDVESALKLYRKASAQGPSTFEGKAAAKAKALQTAGSPPK